MSGRFELRAWVGAILALAAATALAPPPAGAQTTGQTTGKPPGPSFVIRAYYLADSFSHRESKFGVDTFTTITYHGKPGGGLDLEYLPIPWLGIDFAASQTHIQAVEQTGLVVGPTFTTRGNIQVRPFTIGLFAHPLWWERADLYIGPVAGVVDLSGDGHKSETQFGFGSALGLDVPLGSSGLALTALGRIVTSHFTYQLSNVSRYRTNYLFGGGLAYRW
jgi:hypothetical protein